MNVPSFFARPGVQTTIIPVGKGIPFGVERVFNSQVGIGGAYGAWGESYDNTTLQHFVEERLGRPLREEDRMNLSELGFLRRHHVPRLSQEEHLEVEVEVGARLLREAAQACGWEPEEVEGVLIGMSGPVSDDYVERICQRAGIPEHALKVSVHKACDGSMGALHLALNPELTAHTNVENIAETLRGRKVLVGGIEGLSRFAGQSQDAYALQLFGNGASAIGIIPGESIHFLTGKAHEAYDEQGVLAVRMDYPHSRATMLEISQEGPHHIRVAGLMHEPEDGSPVSMAGPMGMVKLFVRTGVQVVTEVYRAYRKLMERLGRPDQSFAVAIVHHANYKINQLKAKHLRREGVNLPMPWLLSEFGNVSAASNLIAFLRELPRLRPGDHILFDGFGAGTYYDVLAVALGG